MRTVPRAAALLALSLVSCSAGVTVRRTGVAAAPRPSGCSLEVLPKPPERPYEELGGLESHVTNPPPEGALEVLKPQACALGAEAIVIVRNLQLNERGHRLVVATAIRYRPEPVPAPPPPGDPAPPETR